ncbi:NACHT domain protein [Nostoc sp. 'Peltigera membranacea cyanobiont' 210A]|uniref:P-loop NTPase fold protein n=1 Tax=Nostoc sp. 'Peltigera membranacea cyanobiont' 210A TaxID=2014529 RepID=UPI000B95919B|nr:P-loop NTPase fold protein [Nostoc sp. 'Peltigera membranacea cyanobiont' 210A]OYD91883.1 NACHT domain protein [Nostoc sp. 'Peltigera membranacea cyanobiont' 210A]
MIEFAAITSVISKYAPQVSQLIIKQAEKNEAVIKILQELKLNPTQIPDDVDTVYGYTLVKYGVFKPEAILNLFREKEIKDYFWDAYSNNDPVKFKDQTKEFLHQNSELKAQIINAKINFLGELEEFGEVFITIAKQTKASRYQSYPDWNLDVYPKEFKALIFEKTRLFCGRDFVFKAIQKFFSTQPKGYFTVVGDAGMGKSAIAAKYVLATKVLCYFNVFAEGRNKPEKFLASIRQQLIKRYSLQNAENVDLSTLLQKASEELKGQKLVIVVDALDEVEQEGNGNLLDLPKHLPDGVYFLLTRRPYNQKTKRLTLSPDTPVDELDLTKSDYTALSQEDVKEYLHLFLNNEQKLRNWINERNISEDNFTQEIAVKSENNFIYLRYLLPEISKGKYNDLTLKGLPQGLQDYYWTHWNRMSMDKESNEKKVKTLYILVERGEPISLNMIAEILDEDKPDVKSVLNDWVEYVTPKVKEDVKNPYYSIYHRSFLDFLKGQEELDKGRKLFREVNKSMANYMAKEIE